MDAQRLTRLGPLLSGYQGEFADCFGRSEQRSHLRAFVLGQLSDLPRKTLEPVALAGGVPPRTLQHFLSRHGWDHGLLRDRLQQRVARAHPHPHSIGIIDETAHVKKGDKTPGTQRQYCGNRGTIDNCVVTVHLGYAAGDFHALLDAKLYLPESWNADRARCRAAGIPDGMLYRPKAGIALELLDRAVANGLRFEWLAVDAGYGMDRDFLNRLRARGQRFVAEVPRHFFGWVRRPAVMHQEFGARASDEHPGCHR
jgi:SRSO17 transposase